MTIETLKKEINALNYLSQDSSFDKTILQDALYLIDFKNKKIQELGGEPIIQQQVVGITEEEALRKIIKQLSVLKKLKSGNPKAEKQYSVLNKILKLKTGVEHEEYLNKGGKFMMGGQVSDVRHIVNNLIQSNEYILLRDSKDDNILKYTTPDGSMLFQVITPNSNVIYGLGYFSKDKFIIDFYEDEDLRQSLNFSYHFSNDYNNKKFKIEYLTLKKLLKDLDNKITI